MSEPTIRVNGAARPLAQGTTVAELVRVLELPVERVAVERNGRVVPRPRWGEVALADGDQVEIVTFVGGG
jgi:thiamine biosynthesis protein ThiS